MSFVSVQEVAEAHFQAIKVPEAANKRFMLVNGAIYATEIAGMLHKEFADSFPKLADGTPCAVRVPKKNYDHSQAEKVLGIKFEADFSKVMIPMVHSMLETGALVKPEL